MGSDKHKQLSELARTPSREVDLSEIERRARRGRMFTIATRAALSIGVASLLGLVLVTSPFFGEEPRVSPAGPSASPYQTEEASRNGAVFEPTTEQERAEIFAFRALAATELMDPYGKRTYNWTYAEDTTAMPDGWRVGFAASDCEPRGGLITCTALSGEDPELGNALTDTFLIVRLDEGAWTVVDVEGNMLPEDEERVVGFSLTQRREPSHWDFASAGVWDGMPSMTPIWVGPYPTSAPGSICETQWIDAEGDRIGEPSSFYQEPPSRPFERGGWVRGGGPEAPNSDGVDVSVTCEQYTGAGWEVVSEPHLVGRPGEVTGVTADLVWRGDEGFTSGAVCRATLLTEDGDVIWEGSGKVHPLWRPGELKDYPYEASVFIHTDGQPVDAEEIGEFDCESR